MKKPVVIILVILIVLIGVGSVFLSRYIRFYKPDWMKEAIAFSDDYIKTNELLIEEYGENFNYKLKGYRADFNKKDGSGFFNGVYYIEDVTYTIEIEAINFEWSVKSFKKD